MSLAIRKRTEYVCDQCGISEVFEHEQNPHDFLPGNWSWVPIRISALGDPGDNKPFYKLVCSPACGGDLVAALIRERLNAKASGE